MKPKPVPHERGKTYAEKLKDKRWLDLRAKFIKFRSDQEREPQCDDCGEDTCGRALHVHHRLYRNGAEPWEYSFDELRLLCCDCHEQIHECERRMRAFIIALPAHVMYEFNDFLDALEECEDSHMVKVSLAQSKNTVRELNHSGGKVSEFMKEFAKEKLGITVI